MKIRIAIYAPHPNQHFAPVFQHLSALPGIEFKAFFDSDAGASKYLDRDFGIEIQWKTPVTSGYDYKILSESQKGSGDSFQPKSDLLAELAKFSPHFLWVFGYNSANHLRALHWGKRHSSVLFLSDSQLQPRRGLATEWLKALFLPSVFRWVDRFITVGPKNENYFSRYAVQKAKMVRGAYPVDIQRFAKSSGANGAERRAKLRAQWGIAEDAIVTLFVGKFIPKKRPQDLIAAYGELKEMGLSKSVLLFIGDGPMKPELNELVASLQLTDQVKFLGFVNQPDIPEVLNCGDIIALPSEYEPYGMVVAESMVFGCAAVVSDAVGCIGADGSAQPGENALVYPCGDVKSLTNCLASLIQNPKMLESMKRRSKEIVTSYDTSRTVSAVFSAMISIARAKGQKYEPLIASIEQSQREYLNANGDLKLSSYSANT